MNHHFSVLIIFHNFLVLRPQTHNKHAIFIDFKKVHILIQDKTTGLTLPKLAAFMPEDDTLIQLRADVHNDDVICIEVYNFEVQYKLFITGLWVIQYGDFSVWNVEFVFPRDQELEILRFISVDLDYEDA